MPIYVYHCDECGHDMEEFQHIHDEPFSYCPACNCPDTFHRVPTLPHTDMKEFAKPIEMQSIGLAHQDEIDEFRKRNPDVEISSDLKNPLYGVPIARTRKEKLTILKKEGFQEANKK